MLRTIGWSVILGSMLAGTAWGGPPEWLADYGVALERTKATGKPLLIVLENGEQPAQSLPVSYTTESTQRELLSRYQLCRVDVTTAYGQAVAKAFEATAFPYTAVIDKTGNYRIFKQSGTMQPENWVATLTRHQDGNVPAQPVEFEYPSGSFGGTVCRT